MYYTRCAGKPVRIDGCGVHSGCDEEPEEKSFSNRQEQESWAIDHGKLFPGHTVLCYPLDDE